MRATELKAHRPIIKDTTATSETIEANITGTSLTNGSSKGNSKLAASSLRSKRKEDTTVRNFDVNAPLPTPIPEESSTSKSQNALSNGFQGKIEDRFQNDIV
ncbi:hypothetical protein K502DRAFT_323557 [Neoconidiobolus thromboides FSU 785]|nr:hypothetical protein K502DRAFT_323557 [Neoconidiobolus thromboides FSU 785]